MIQNLFNELLLLLLLSLFSFYFFVYRFGVYWRLNCAVKVNTTKWQARIPQFDNWIFGIFPNRFASMVWFSGYGIFHVKTNSGIDFVVFVCVHFCDSFLFLVFHISWNKKNGWIHGVLNIFLFSAWQCGHKHFTVVYCRNIKCCCGVVVSCE